MLLALDAAAKSTIGLAVVFFVAFPLLVHAIIGYIAAQVVGEHRANNAYASGDEIGESHG
jgi:hypothetical protein